MASSPGVADGSRRPDQVPLLPAVVSLPLDAGSLAVETTSGVGGGAGRRRWINVPVPSLPLATGPPHLPPALACAITAVLWARVVLCFNSPGKGDGVRAGWMVPSQAGLFRLHWSCLDLKDAR